MLVPRKRTYCEAATAGMRKVMRFHSVCPGTVVQVLALKVLITAALRFLAAAGTLVSARSCCGLARSTQSSGQTPL